MKKLLLIVSFLLLFVGVSNATQPSNTSVTKLYVATFDRAPDKAGLDYWVNDSGLSLESIATSFFDQPETKALYPDGFDDYDFILAIYENLFKRVPDSAGSIYWELELSTGVVSKSVFILAVVNGAKGDDATILQNKTDVGLEFVESGSDDTIMAKSVMENVTTNRQTVTDSFNKISNINTNGDGNKIHIGDINTDKSKTNIHQDIDNSETHIHQEIDNSKTEIDKSEIHIHQEIDNSKNTIINNPKDENKAPTIVVKSEVKYGAVFEADASASYDDKLIFKYEWRDYNGNLLSEDSYIRIIKGNIKTTLYDMHNKDLFYFAKDLDSNINSINLKIIDNDGKSSTKELTFDIEPIDMKTTINYRKYIHFGDNAIELNAEDTYIDTTNIDISSYTWTINNHKLVVPYNEFIANPKLYLVSFMSDEGRSMVIVDTDDELLGSYAFELYDLFDETTLKIQF